MKFFQYFPNFRTLLKLGESANQLTFNGTAIGDINSILPHISVSPDGLPLWDGKPWPGGSSTTVSQLVVSDASDGNRYQIVMRDGSYATVELASGIGTPLIIVTQDTVTGLYYQIYTVNGGIANKELISGVEQNTTIIDEITGIHYKIIVENGVLGQEEL